MSLKASDLLHQLFVKSPSKRINMQSIRAHPWLTDFAFPPLPSEEENTTIDINVTDEEVKQSLTEILPTEALVSCVQCLECFLSVFLSVFSAPKFYSLF